MSRLTLNQALIFAVLAALLPIAIFSIAQSFSGREYARQLIAERLVTSALATAATQNEPIATAQRLFATFAQDKDVMGATDDCHEVLARSLSDQLVSFGFSDARGEVQCSALPFKKPVSVADRPWWYQGIANRKFTLSAPTIGKISKRRLIVAMQPLFDSNGQFSGALTAGIDATWIEQALKRRKLSRNAIVALADGSGKVMMTGDQRPLPKVDLASSFGSAATLTDAGGVKWLYSSAPLYGRQLHVVYAEPQFPLLSPSRDQLLINLLLPVLTILFSWLAIWWAVNRFVVRWIQALRGMARRFALGDYSIDNQRYKGAPAEIAALSVDLQHMARSIEDRDVALRAANETTKAMAREVNHRVKNNLQTVQSLLGLQANRLIDHEARRVLDQTRLRVGAVSLIHRLLYEFDDSSERGQVDMDRLLVELIGQLRNNFGMERVALECKSTIGTISVDQAIPLTLLVVEGTTNAYRHAFAPDHQGKINISLTSDGDIGSLSIVDNGAGYDSGATEAMGLELMHAFAEQLEGKLTIESEPGKGVSLLLTYPVRRNIAAPVSST